MATNYATVTPLIPRETKQQQTANSTTTTPRARAREAIERIGEYYCRAFGRRSCAPSIYNDIIEALSQGMTAKTICLCIDAAQDAERPSWAYTRAVIRRCIQEGCKTPEAFAARAQRHRQGEGQAFTQRTYTQEQLEALTDAMFDNIP